MTTFLVGVDGSEGARKAAFFAAERARAEKARLLLAHVTEWTSYAPMMPEEMPLLPVEPHDETERAMGEVLRPLKEALATEDLEVELLVRHGHAATRLAELAREYRVDQVFTGRRGRSRVAAMLFGSVSRELVQSCPVPVTVVPQRSWLEDPSGLDVEAGSSREYLSSRSRG